MRKTGRKYGQLGIVIGSLCLAAAVPVSAAQQPAAAGLLSATQEAQIRAIGDGSGKYLLKSEGFYCLNEDGTADDEAAVHYFHHMEIDGTVLDGFYYHDKTGHFMAGSSHVEKLTNLSCNRTEEGEDWISMTGHVFDGIYMVNNLGKLTAAPQVRYITGLTVDKTTYEGYYYFDENGRMVTEPDLHSLDMTSNGQRFDGTYYFGGADGVLVQEAGVTPDGFPVDETGKVTDMDNLGMDTLEPRLASMLDTYDGAWSVYVKNLNTGEEILLNNTPMYAASLIKAFVMADTYANMDEVLEHEAAQMKTTVDNPEVKVKVNDLLWNMITVSDNESCNELGRLQSAKHDFLDGAQKVEDYIKEEGYEDTSYQTTIHPSSSPTLSLGGHNTTTVRDCGLLLERIFKGECVSWSASQEMLNLLMNQENTAKIPSGITADIPIANKTGETDEDQHDIAIVYGPKTTYILCVMSKDFQNADTAVENIRSISRTVYYYLNLN